MEVFSAGTDPPVSLIVAMGLVKRLCNVMSESWRVSTLTVSENSSTINSRSKSMTANCTRLGPVVSGMNSAGRTAIFGSISTTERATISRMRSCVKDR